MKREIDRSLDKPTEWDYYYEQSESNTEFLMAFFESLLTGKGQMIKNIAKRRNKMYNCNDFNSPLHCLASHTNTSENDWESLDLLPDSGVGVDYGYRHTSGKEGYVNRDQDTYVVSVCDF